MKRLTAFDAVGAWGESVPLRAVLERRWLKYLRQPLREAPVSFRLDTGVELGSVFSDSSGTATIVVSVHGHRFTAYSAGAAPGHGCLYRFAADAPLLVCDLDMTVSDASAFRFWLAPNSLVEPFEGAAEALRTLSHHFRIVYLTARRDIVFEKTREWLRMHLFPPGPVIGRRWSLFPPSPEAFKREALSELKRSFTRVLIGIGDRAHDARAYLAHGMTAIAFRPTRSVPQEAVVCDRWDQIVRLCLGR